jgi:hypothetical protein
LGVPEVGEDVALVNPKLGVGVGGGILSLRDSAYYYRDEGGVADYGGVEGGGVGVAKKMEPAGHAAGFGAGEIGGVGVDTE